MKLVVDVGNSRMKWALWDQGRLIPGDHADRREPLAMLLDEVWSGLETPEAVLVSSVAGEAFGERMALWMKSRWGRRPDWFRSERETLGIVNGYADPGRLGSDRWAALIGARALQPGPLGVVDCGTAVTLDALDGRDRHLGGWIFPGLVLSRQSLLTRTANIGEASPRMAGHLGRSTAECVANGTLLGLAGVLELWMAVVERELTDVTWMATGGDWSHLAPLIERPVRHDPELVLRGLARVLEDER